MKRIIWLIMGVITVAAIGLVVYQSDLNSLLERSNSATNTTPTPSLIPLVPDSEAVVEYRDEFISFSYPSNWQEGTRQCDDVICSLAFTTEEREEKLSLLIIDNLDPLTQEQFNTLEEYLAEMYPDKTIINSTQSVDDKVTIHEIEGLGTELLFQLPISKKFVSLVFTGSDESKDTVMNSLQVLE